MMLYKTYSCTSWLNRLILLQEDIVHGWGAEASLPCWNRRAALPGSLPSAALCHLSLPSWETKTALGEMRQNRLIFIFIYPSPMLHSQQHLNWNIFHAFHILINELIHWLYWYSLCWSKFGDPAPIFGFHCSFWSYMTMGNSLKLSELSFPPLYHLRNKILPVFLPEFVSAIIPTNISYTKLSNTYPRSQHHLWSVATKLVLRIPASWYSCLCVIASPWV